MSALTVSLHRGVQTITLSRPEVRNAFNDVVIAELKSAFLAVAQDPAVRCVVLAAEGPAFCAGADLHWGEGVTWHSSNRARDGRWLWGSVAS